MPLPMPLPLPLVLGLDWFVADLRGRLKKASVVGDAAEADWGRYSLEAG